MRIARPRWLLLVTIATVLLGAGFVRRTEPRAARGSRSVRGRSPLAVACVYLSSRLPVAIIPSGICGTSIESKRSPKTLMAGRTSFSICCRCSARVTLRKLQLPHCCRAVRRTKTISQPVPAPVRPREHEILRTRVYAAPARDIENALSSRELPSARSPVICRRPRFPILSVAAPLNRGRYSDENAPVSEKGEHLGISSLREARQSISIHAFPYFVDLRGGPYPFRRVIYVRVE